MGKAGYVYQAANFLYGGNFKTLVYRTKYGEKVHPRTASDLCKENAKFLGKEKVLDALDIYETFFINGADLDSYCIKGTL